MIFYLPNTETLTELKLSYSSSDIVMAYLVHV